ncbi:uncharacterized protein C22orf31 isoform X1 [Etheostoma spectabile]|uniref:uncharacterized protein C22orf31 isoform X1 n=1 Tax=Etheostoma spectabile TaxID=54343 RepID=UPI0013AF11BF|nr:uncharacterized protein C22orf31-like isoform X1 [Etheostoma spectabile]XP_032357622.1 uncharacterized protein C22orf31-like isoform X1 [Etheostoma spectabile]
MWPEHTHRCCQRRNETRPYGLRRSIRCPKKYGETIKERKYMLTPNYDLDLVCEQSKADPQKLPDDRYIRNAAVLPDLKLSHRDGALTTEERTSSSVPTSQPGPLMIHGFTVPEYQQTYHSVVDPLLFRPCGKLAAYSLELGRNIKEHLFKEMAYPTIQSSEQPNGEIKMMERFCVLRPTPFLDIDSYGEPQ